MERNQMDFYKLYSCAVGVPDDLPIEEMDAEDLDLAESMCGHGLIKFMELKTRILNAKHKLQTSDMQRGVLPQTEEGKEGICVEADTDKAKVPNNGNYAEVVRGLGREFSSKYAEADWYKANLRQAQTPIGTVPFPSRSILKRIIGMRGGFVELHENGNGNTPQIRKDE